MLLRVQVGLFILFSVFFGATSSYFYFKESCYYAGILNLVIYTFPVIAGILAQSFWRKLTLRIFKHTMVYCGVIALIA